MHVRGFGLVFGALLLASIGLSGCSQEEGLKLDPGVSPFYPGDSASPTASTKTDTTRDQPSGQPAGSRTKVESTVPIGPIRPDKVEQVRVALRFVQKGESVKAAQILIKSWPSSRSIGRPWPGAAFSHSNNPGWPRPCRIGPRQPAERRSWPGHFIAPMKHRRSQKWISTPRHSPPRPKCGCSKARTNRPWPL